MAAMESDCVTAPPVDTGERDLTVMGNSHRVPRRCVLRQSRWRWPCPGARPRRVWPDGMRGVANSGRGRGTVPGRMRTVPIDQGPRDRRRIGPFWVEEGLGLVAVGAAVLAAVTALYVVAVLYRPT